MTAATLAPPRWTQRSSVPPAQRRDTEPNVRRPMADRANGTAAHRSVTATRLWPRSRYPISARTPPSPRPTAPHRTAAPPQSPLRYRALFSTSTFFSKPLIAASAPKLLALLAVPLSHPRTRHDTHARTLSTAWTWHVHSRPFSILHSPFSISNSISILSCNNSSTRRDD